MSDKDTIYRQDAIDAAHERIIKKWKLFHEKSLNEQDVKDMLNELPSAQPEPEHTMEEFMYGQELGDPEDGSL